VVLGIALWMAVRWRGGDRGAQPIRSVAVLAPKVIGADPSVGLGIADAVITRLSALQRVVVRPTVSISRYMESGEDRLAIGRALNVDAVLDGTLQCANGRVRITMRLIDVRSGASLWTGTFDEKDGDIFRLEDRISVNVADAMALNLNREQRSSLHARPTTNPEAWALYSKGNYYWSQRGEGVSRGIPYFQKAIEIDPNFARAYVGLANVHAVTSARSPEAEVLIEKALQIDGNLADAHATRGLIRMFHHWDWNGAEQAFDRAIALDPNCVPAHHWRGVLLSLRGRLDEAKAEMHRALELDPRSAIITADIGQLHYFAREYDQAAKYCRRALELDSDLLWAHRYLRDMYLVQKRDREAVSEYMAMGYLEPRDKYGRPAPWDRFARSGLRGVLLPNLDSELPPDHKAWICVAAGEEEQAIQWLGRSFDAHDFLLPFINVDPLFDTVRGDPRVQDIVRRMGLSS
jgi:TolB-like protein/tetratricopeptide (TPR) repeat protein